MLSSYVVEGKKIKIYSAYSESIVETCRKWGGKYENGCWNISSSRLQEVQEMLGVNQADQVEVEVNKSNWNGYAQISVGWYVLASRRGRDSRADIYADLIAGEIPKSGGSMKNPGVCPSSDARFRLFVPRDFAIVRNLLIIEEENESEKTSIVNKKQEIVAMIKSIMVENKISLDDLK